MSALETPRASRRWWRWTAFRVGGLFGLATGALFSAWIYGLAFPPGPSIDVVVNGADATRHGISRIVVRDHYRNELAQACVEGCDDLRIWLRSGDNAFTVAAYDGNGQCIGCDAGGAYVSGAGDLVRWTVGGRERLEVRMKRPSSIGAPVD